MLPDHVWRQQFRELDEQVGVESGVGVAELVPLWACRC
jgi:hypothetical protein